MTCACGRTPDPGICPLTHDGYIGGGHCTCAHETVSADKLVADARRAVHEALVVLPAPEADRVRSLIADLETAVEGRTALRAPAVPVSSTPPDQTAVERSERYATAIHDAMEPDLSLAYAPSRSSRSGSSARTGADPRRPTVLRPPPTPAAATTPLRNRMTDTSSTATEATEQPVIALYEQWVKAGPPPLGASMARWWDTRLTELRKAISEQPARTTPNNSPISSNTADNRPKETTP